MIFTDGSSKRVRGGEQAGNARYYGEGDEGNFACPLNPLGATDEWEGRGQGHATCNAEARGGGGGRWSLAIGTDSEICFNAATKHILMLERRE